MICLLNDGGMWVLMLMLIIVCVGLVYLLLFLVSRLISLCLLLMIRLFGYFNCVWV